MRLTRLFTTLLVSATLSVTLCDVLSAQAAPTHGVRPTRLVIRGATIIEGNGTPAEGPKDIVIEGNRIAQIVSLDPVAIKDGTARRPTGDVIIDATGKYVMPGLINLHGHVQDERGGIAQPLEYQMKLWLGMGITTVRDVSSETPKTLQLRARSLSGDLLGPRLYVYARYAYMPVPRNEVEARQRVRDLKAHGQGRVSGGARRGEEARAEDGASHGGR